MTACNGVGRQVFLKWYMAAQEVKVDQIALELADGIAVVEMADAKKDADAERIIFSSRFACPVSGFGFSVWG